MFLGWLGEFCVVHGAHLFVLSNDVQTGLELVAAAASVRNGSKLKLSLGKGYRVSKVGFWLVLYFYLMEEG
jgi:hypothetical protein